MRVYIGEIHYPDGRFTLVGSELNFDDHTIIEIEVDGEEQHLHAFNTHKEAVDTTSLFAATQNISKWNVRFVDIELEKYCDLCGTDGHLEEDCDKFK